MAGDVIRIELTNDEDRERNLLELLGASISREIDAFEREKKAPFLRACNDLGQRAADRLGMPRQRVRAVVGLDGIRLELLPGPKTPPPGAPPSEGDSDQNEAAEAAPEEGHTTAPPSPSPSPSPEPLERCPYQHEEHGRCTLPVGHSSQHAGYASGTW